VAIPLLSAQADITIVKSLHSLAKMGWMEDLVAVKLFLSQADIASVMPSPTWDQVLSMS